jgi:hypothetical protein
LDRLILVRDDTWPQSGRKRYLHTFTVQVPANIAQAVGQSSCPAFHTGLDDVG